MRAPDLSFRILYDHPVFKGSYSDRSDLSNGAWGAHSLSWSLSKKVFRSCRNLCDYDEQSDELSCGPHLADRGGRIISTDDNGQLPDV